MYFFQTQKSKTPKGTNSPSGGVPADVLYVADKKTQDIYKYSFMFFCTSGDSFNEQILVQHFKVVRLQSHHQIPPRYKIAIDPTNYSNTTLTATRNNKIYEPIAQHVVTNWMTADASGFLYYAVDATNEIWKIDLNSEKKEKTLVFSSSMNDEKVSNVGGLAGDDLWLYWGIIFC